MLVDRAPAVPRDQIRALLGQELLASFTVAVGGRVELAGLAVLEDAGDGVGRVLLVGADDAGGAALDPADDVFADLVLAALAKDAAAEVADQAAALVEGDAGQRRAAVADRAQDEAAGDDLLLAGRDGAAVLDPVLDDADAGHATVLALAEDLDRGAEEAQLDAVMVAVRLAL